MYGRLSLLKLLPNFLAFLQSLLNVYGKLITRACLFLNVFS